MLEWLVASSVRSFRCSAPQLCHSSLPLNNLDVRGLHFKGSQVSRTTEWGAADSHQHMAQQTCDGQTLPRSTWKKELGFPASSCKPGLSRGFPPKYCYPLASVNQAASSTLALQWYTEAGCYQLAPAWKVYCENLLPTLFSKMFPWQHEISPLGIFTTQELANATKQLPFLS